jgi:hypothetical protein
MDLRSRPQVRAWLALSAALGIASCAKSLEDLGTYPCADDGSCPRGRVCDVDRMCVPARPGSPCVPDATDCRAAHPEATCALGVCAAPCDDTRPCDAGFVCSAPAGQGGHCLAACGPAQGCGGGLACVDVWHARARACVGPGTSVPACVSATAVAACAGTDSVCGTSLDHGERCSNGTRCPRGTRCDGAGGCFTDCPGGSEAQLCAGAPCRGPECVADGWWCAPTSLSLGCDQDPSHFIAGCSCSDGRLVVSACGQPRSCEALCQDTCDPVAQDCGDPATTKCSRVEEGDLAINHRCVPLTGARAEGEPCAGAGTGRDDCAAGLHCTYRLDPAGQPTCGRFCDIDADCGSPASVCWTISLADGSRVCAPRCTPFGDDCPAGMVCKLDTDTGAGACLRLDERPAPLDGPCVGFSHHLCEGELLCNGLGRCKTPCDPAHPCAAGRCSGEGSQGGRGVCLDAGE